MSQRAPATPALLACAAMLAPALAHADPRGIGEPPPPLTPELIEARRVKMAADMSAWLPRLVGRFKVYGVVDYNGDTSDDDKDIPVSGMEFDNTPLDEDVPPETDVGDPIDPLKIKEASGKADCIAIGKGPGVHCLFHVSWDAEWKPSGNPVDGGDPFLAPAMKLFGLEPNAGVIHHLQLDTDGVAELQTAKLKNHTLTWIYPTRCESDTNPLMLCRRTSRIYSRPGSRVIQWAIDYEKWDPTLDQNDTKWLRVTSFVLDLRRDTEDRLSEAAMPATRGLR